MYDNYRRENELTLNCYELSDKERTKYGKQRTVKLEHLNWDEECASDIITGKGFYITSKDPLTLKIDSKTNKEKSVKDAHGLFSPLFGTEWSDENAFADRYSCKCKELIGKLYEGEVCRNCGTKVEYIDSQFDIFGWINIGDHKIIQPNFFVLLQSLIGKSKLIDIITFKAKFDLNGNFIKDFYVTKDNPWLGVGMTRFYEEYEDILYYFYKKKKSKFKLYKRLLQEKDKVFASNIPVYSSLLRPEAIRSETMYVNKENSHYKVIIRLSTILRDPKSKDKNSKTQFKYDAEDALSRIQDKLLNIYNLIFTKLNKKTGYIKQEVLGSRLSFTSRCVIIPDSTLECNEIDLPYLAFLELYKLEIIGWICQLNNTTESIAFDIWNQATVRFDPKIYEIMLMIVDRYQPYMLINRNPTINYGSMLVMKVRTVKRDYKKLSMSLPIAVLKVLNADFDGDTLNILALKTKSLKKKYGKNFDPLYNFFIDRLTGEFNTDFDLLKDQQIGLHAFMNI